MEKKKKSIAASHNAATMEGGEEGRAKRLGRLGLLGKGIPLYFPNPKRMKERGCEGDG